MILLNAASILAPAGADLLDVASMIVEGNTLTLADIAIVLNFIVYQYMGYAADTGRYPKLAKHLNELAAT